MKDKIEQLIEDIANMSAIFIPHHIGPGQMVCPFCSASNEQWSFMCELKHEKDCTWLLARELYNESNNEDKQKE